MTPLEQQTIAVLAVSQVRRIMGFKDRGLEQDRADLMERYWAIREHRAALRAAESIRIERRDDRSMMRVERVPTNHARSGVGAGFGYVVGP